MSRVGKAPIAIPEKVEVNIQGSKVAIKGPLWEMMFTCRNDVEIVKQENQVVVNNKNATTGKYWGTTRAVLASMVTWVSQGFKKSLEIQWVGYKFDSANADKLIMSLGYAHKVEVQIPKWLKVEIDAKEKNVVHVSGIDKQAVGQLASQIKKQKLPEPYKGKGIRYVGEQIKRKAGKTASK